MVPILPNRYSQSQFGLLHVSGQAYYMATERCFNEGSMDTSHSPALEPVCEVLKAAFQPLPIEAMPSDLSRLMEALDDAYATGALFGAGSSAPRFSRR